MTRFLDCPNHGDLFDEALRRSRMGRWRPGDPIRARGKRFLIGVAIDSPIELFLLDCLNERLVSPHPPPGEVDVFSVLECRDVGDLESYVPGIGAAYQTPIVGLWDDGIPTRRNGGDPPATSWGVISASCPRWLDSKMNFIQGSAKSLIRGGRAGA